MGQFEGQYRTRFRGGVVSASGQAAALHGTDDAAHVGATRAHGIFPAGEQEGEGDYFGVGMIERHEREEDLPSHPSFLPLAALACRGKKMKPRERDQMSHQEFWIGLVLLVLWELK